MVYVGGGGGGNCLSLVNLKIFAFQRAHCLLTVRRCSSVGKLLSWLDSNGKHKVRLVTKHRMGFVFCFFFKQNSVNDCMETHLLYE